VEEKKIAPGPVVYIICEMSVLQVCR